MKLSVVCVIAVVGVFLAVVVAVVVVVVVEVVVVVNVVVNVVVPYCKRILSFPGLFFIRS